MTDTWTRVTKQTPCPICGKIKYCSVGSDGVTVWCAHEQSVRPSPEGRGWLHSLGVGGPARAGALPGGSQAAHATKQTAPPKPGPRGPSTVTRYGVMELDGTLVAVHCRRDFADGSPKEVWWELPDGTKGLKGLNLEDLPLYNTELLASAPLGATVILCEGEKAAQALCDLGTGHEPIYGLGTVTGAATIPKKARLRVLTGFNVHLWADNDDEGHRHMAAVSARLRVLGIATSTYTWYGAPSKGDAADWAEAGAVWGNIVVSEMSEDEAELSDDPGPTDRRLHLTDMGNAERLIRRHGPDIRWCAPWKRWLTWGGETWNENGDDQVQERAKETARAIHDEALEVASEDVAEAVGKHAARSEGAGRIAAMMTLARSTPALAVTPDDLDRDPWLLNCANGTIDLRRGELLPFTREDLMTKRSPAIYDTSATCPIWLAFLEQIFAGDAEMIGFMQRVAGYCMSGSTAERVLFILFGPGRNGKSTWLEVIRHVMGDYAAGTPASTIMARRDKGVPNDIARLKGARFVSASETNEAAEIDEAFIKTATGGDTVTARFLNQEFFEYIPHYKLLFATNHKPAIRGTDPAVWDRLRLLSFGVRIPEEHIDKRLRDKLIAEADGILQWMIAGCLDWQRLGGLGEPAAVLSATNEYKIGEDMFAGFLESRCHVGSGTQALAGALYKVFSAWAERNGEEVISQRRFGDRLRELGFARDRNATGQRIWRGLELLTADEQAVQDG